ncbi:hypothetical protein CPC08DRAFT_730482 [Agrocybe pediades]|nr:hypothetical protein CPC08DRAFT_730482 [Agrocybe pediades]
MDSGARPLGWTKGDVDEIAEEFTVVAEVVILAEAALVILALLAWAENVEFEAETDVEVEATLLATVDAEIPETAVVVEEIATDSVAVTVAVVADTDVVDAIFSGGETFPPGLLNAFALSLILTACPLVNESMHESYEWSMKLSE